MFRRRWQQETSRLFKINTANFFSNYHYNLRPTADDGRDPSSDSHLHSCNDNRNLNHDYTDYTNRRQYYSHKFHHLDYYNSFSARIVFINSGHLIVHLCDTDDSTPNVNVNSNLFGHPWSNI